MPPVNFKDCGSQWNRRSQENSSMRGHLEGTGIIFKKYYSI